MRFGAGGTGGGEATKRVSRSTSATTRPIGANERIRVACVGVRGRGMEHVNGFLKQGNVEVTAICDVDSNVVGPAMRVVEDKTGKRPAFVQDYRRILADRTIDVVSLATPNHWHALQTIWACEAGKDVYVEKPVSHNIFEGRQMLAAARKYERVVQAGTQSRSMTSIKDAIKFVKSGQIGDLQIARGLCYKRRKSIGHKVDEVIPPVGVDYNLWLGPAAVRPFNQNRFHYEWHWNWDYGAGDLGNQGIHQMDICRWGIGASGLPAQTLSFGGRYGYEDDGQTPNTLVTWMDYGKAQLIFEVRGLETEKYMEQDIAVVFHCADGHVMIPFGGGKKVTAYDGDGKVLMEFAGEKDHFANFVDAVRSRKSGDLAAEIREGVTSTAPVSCGEYCVSDGRGRCDAGGGSGGGE